MLFSQQFTWVEKPSISGFDDVKIYQSGPYFIVATKDGKAGVLNPKGKEICPIKYDKIGQVKETYFCAYHPKDANGSKQTWYSEDGKILDFETDINAKNVAKQKQDNQDTYNKVHSDISALFPGVSIIPNNEYSNTIITSQGDTISTKMYFSKARVLCGKYLKYNDEKRVMVVNQSLETLSLIHI